MGEGKATGQAGDRPGQANDQGDEAMMTGERCQAGDDQATIGRRPMIRAIDDDDQAMGGRAAGDPGR